MTAATSAGARFDAVLEAPFGAVGVAMSGHALARVVFLPPGTPALAPRGDSARRAADQIEAYLADPEVRIELPVCSQGTDFQRCVWRAIARIAPGTTRRYGELAAEVGSAARAVGQACGANPLPIVVPCHRVVSATGMGGFANATDGYLIATKRWLLAHEAARRP